MVYFAPETERLLTGAGLEPGRMTYFAGRAAPMGAVSASVVAATFYNFNPDLVARHIPAAWELADPATLVAARFAAADAALRRLLGDETVASPAVAEAAGLARRAAEACDPQGRPLAAGHLDLEWPVEPHLVLWHALSILREHRGDGHIALLLDAGLTGIEALVTATATGKGFVVPFAKASRGWSDAQWDGAVAALRSRGLLGDGDGSGPDGLGLTAEGDALRRRLEGDTDRLGAGPWSHLGADDAGRLAELGGVLVRTLVAAGCFPDGVFAAR
ncbi:hypothetical protein HF526_25380 [Pseudonocardia sp. K10HN5]|uniref:SalK n=2 Tax=Pseudonocardia acidicola TaxID=2724939 RepID=A0ABX1SGD0_9PSEU|nr:hypothetical protein [Pseudonocardia acidicola]NMI00614.1 hypothetical protein [Pseudonocardia acidicola]